MNHDQMRNLALIFQMVYMAWVAIYPYLIAFAVTGSCLTLVSRMEQRWIKIKSKNDLGSR